MQTVIHRVSHRCFKNILFMNYLLYVKYCPWVIMCISYVELLCATPDFVVCWHLNMIIHHDINSKCVHSLLPILRHEHNFLYVVSSLTCSILTFILSHSFYIPELSWKNNILFWCLTFCCSSRHFCMINYDCMSNNVLKWHYYVLWNNTATLRTIIWA